MMRRMKLNNPLVAFCDSHNLCHSHAIPIAGSLMSNIKQRDSLTNFSLSGWFIPTYTSALSSNLVCYCKHGFPCSKYWSIHFRFSTWKATRYSQTMNPGHPSRPLHLSNDTYVEHWHLLHCNSLWLVPCLHFLWRQRLTMSEWSR
jgi:hypothetical protein